MKPKLIICSLIFMIGSILNVFFSTALHNILAEEMRTLEFISFFKCINSIVNSKQHFLMFLCLQGFIVILAIVFYLTNMRPYQSHLNTVTPDIQTPAAVGQYQHGSAKWLSDKEMDKAFDSFVLDTDDELIKELLQRGYDGLEFMQNKI